MIFFIDDLLKMETVYFLEKNWFLYLIISLFNYDLWSSLDN